MDHDFFQNKVWPRLAWRIPAFKSLKVTRRKETDDTGDLGPLGKPVLSLCRPASQPLRTVWSMGPSHQPPTQQWQRVLMPDQERGQGVPAAFPRTPASCVPAGPECLGWLLRLQHL